jgi:hypothetical protein
MYLIQICSETGKNNLLNIFGFETPSGIQVLELLLNMNVKFVLSKLS